MSTTLEPQAAPPPPPTPPTPPTPAEIDVHSFEHHWQDEADAAYLYRILAAAEPDPKKKDIYARLADVEDRHVVVWSDLLAKHGHPPANFRPSGRARLLARFGRWFGPGFLLPMLLEEEGREVKAYLDMHRETPRGAPGGAEALVLARESADHATTLGGIAGKGAEPWHRTATHIMADPQRMLKEQVQEALKIGEFSMSPLKEGWLTGLATAFGAVIPVFPFLLWHGATAIVISFGVSMLSHFLVGGARSIFTGRGVFRSGFDMFVVGMGVAVVGYFVGGWVGKLI